MSFKPLRTSADDIKTAHKVLLYSTHGWGKTTQAVNMQRRYGNGFIISGEGGLRSIGAAEIDYLPFSSWDGKHDPEAGVYSFVGIIKMMNSADFRALDYKWIMLDSLTELSDMLLGYLEDKHKDNKNKFDKWTEYAQKMLGVLKYVRDMPYHVVVTSLAADEEDDNKDVHYWPALKGRQVAKQLCGIFDHVIAGVRVTHGDKENPTVRRFMVLEEVRGYHGKLRDPYQRFSGRPVVEIDDVTEVLNIISMSPKEYEKIEKAMADAIAAEQQTKEEE